MTLSGTRDFDYEQTHSCSAIQHNWEAPWHPHWRALLQSHVRATLGIICQFRALRFLFDQGSGVTLKSRRRMLPLRSQSDVIPIWHSHLRQTLGVHDLVLSDDAVLIEEKGSQSVYLIGF